MDTALACVGRVAKRLPGAEALLYDGLPRGKHLDVFMRRDGLLPIVPVTAASGGRRARKPRVERTVHVGVGKVNRPDGKIDQCQLYATAGALASGNSTSKATSW